MASLCKVWITPRACELWIADVCQAFAWCRRSCSRHHSWNFQLSYPRIYRAPLKKIGRWESSSTGKSIFVVQICSCSPFNSYCTSQTTVLQVPFPSRRRSSWADPTRQLPSRSQQESPRDYLSYSCQATNCSPFTRPTYELALLQYLRIHLDCCWRRWYNHMLTFFSDQSRWWAVGFASLGAGGWTPGLKSLKCSGMSRLGSGRCPCLKRIDFQCKKSNSDLNF